LGAKLVVGSQDLQFNNDVGGLFDLSTYQAVCQ